MEGPLGLIAAIVFLVLCCLPSDHDSDRDGPYRHPDQWT
jgi:hypothetical protein